MNGENKTNINEVWHIYLVRTAVNTLYCGVTTNVVRRFSEHQRNGTKAARYLRGKGPLTLVWSQPVGTRSEALKLEYRVKRLTRAAKEQLVLSGQWPGASD